MGPAIGLALFAGFMTLLALGRFALVRDAEKSVRDWARVGGYTLERCERAPSLVASPRPTWLVRVVDAEGARREAWVKTGWSVKEPVDVLWAAPGSSVFR